MSISEEANVSPAGAGNPPERTWLWYIFQPYKWLIYVPYLGVSTFLFGTLAMIFSVLINPRMGGKLAAVPWARTNALLAMMPISIEGQENISSKHSYVVVANHQSLFDIFVIYGWLDSDLRWVMKQELRKVPVLGYASEKLEHIFIDRSNSAAAIASLNTARERLVGGTSILFFPEGTRSKTGALGRFKKGAFRMALDLQLPILPITVVGTNKVLPSGGMNLFPGRAKLVIHKPIPTDAKGIRAVDLMKQSFDAIESALE